MSERPKFIPEQIHCKSSIPLEQLSDMEEVNRLQIIMLNSLLDHAKKSRFYSRRIAGTRLTSLTDLSQILPLTREEITYFGSLSSHEMETGERKNGWIFRSSGASGKPFFSIRTREDVEIHLSRAGRFMEYVLDENDVVFNCNSMGAGWSGGISAHDFLSRTRAMSIGLGSILKPEEFAEFWKEIKPNTIIGMPSFLVKLAENLSEIEGLSRIDKAFFVGEPFWADERKLFKQKLGTPYTSVFGHYANTECGAVGMQICNLTQDNVYHVIPDGNIVEIVDPETLQPTELGQPGKIILTSFNRLHIPMIRLVTDDLGCLQPECKCGLHTQMLEVLGKSTGELVKIGRRQISMRKFMLALVSDLAIQGLQIPTKQLHLSRDTSGELKIDILLESPNQPKKPLTREYIINLLSLSSAELGTVPLDYLTKVNIDLQFVPIGTIQGVGTVGKVPLIIDNRE